MDKFKGTLVDLSIRKNWIYKINESKLAKYSAMCIATGCPWKVRARVYKSWAKIATYVGEHKCATQKKGRDHPLATSE